MAFTDDFEKQILNLRSEQAELVAIVARGGARSQRQEARLASIDGMLQSLEKNLLVLYKTSTRVYPRVPPVDPQLFDVVCGYCCTEYADLRGSPSPFGFECANCGLEVSLDLR